MRFNHLCRVILCSLTATFFWVGMSSLLAQPVVDLGPDLFACDSATLDAGNSGATYLWNTAETAQTITVTSSGIYWVDVTDGGGTTRDSVEVEIVASPGIPVLNDTSVCGPGMYQFDPLGTYDQIFWFEDNLASVANSVSPDLSLLVSDDTTLYYEAATFGGVDSVGPETFVGNGFSRQGNDRGLIFDVLSPVVLESVTVFAQQPGVLKIMLENSSGTELMSRTVEIPVGGDAAYEVPLYFSLPVGTDLRLAGIKISGLGSGLVFNNNGLTFPYDLPGQVSITSGDGLTSRYYYFYNWKVLSGACFSPRGSAQITVLDAPVVDLGNDTAVCGNSILLDVTNPGATYLWSTGDTSPTLTVTQTDTISVAATIGSCTLSDTAFVELVPAPSSPILADTSVCGPGQYMLSPTGTYDQVFWYQSATTTEPISTSDAIEVSISQDSVFYFEGINLGLQDSVGLPDFSGLSFNRQGNDRGLDFDVFTPSVLESVTVYADEPGVVEIKLEDSGGGILASKVVDIPIGNDQAVEIPLFFDLPVGNGFRLAGTRLSGLGSGLVFTNTSLPFPYEIPGRLSIYAGNGATNRYYYFYNWQVTTKLCNSPRDSVSITILDAPIFDLGADTTVCGDNLVLDASFPGATYIWNTAETTPSITVTNTDTFSVIASIGACSTEDTISVELVALPDAPMINDTSVCGPGTYQFFAGGVFDQLLWYDSLDATQFVAEGISPALSIGQSTTLYVESLNFGQTDTTGVEDLSGFSPNFQGNDRGLDFDVHGPSLLKSVSVYADEPGMMVVYLRDNSGQILDSAVVEILMGNAQKTVIPLYWDLEPGTGYELSGVQLSGLGSGLAFLNVPLPFPYTLPGRISITGGEGLNNRYYYFYEWVVTSKTCPSQREAFEVTVLPSPVVEFGLDTAVCGSSLILDATNSGATYLWNTGDTSPTLTVTATDTFSVTASIGSCTVADTIAVELVATPAAPQANDTTYCGIGLYPYSAEHEGELLVWYVDDMTEEFFATGDSIEAQTDDTTTFFVESFELSSIQTVGRSVGNPNSLSFQGNERGVEFDVHRPLTLAAVTMYPIAPTEVSIILENAQGQVLDSVTVALEDGTGQVVPLFFDLEPGTGYRLLGRNITDGDLGFFNSGSAYPYELPDEISLTGQGTGTGDGFYYFFDWQIIRQYCRSPRVPVTVEIALPLQLGDDMYACEEVILDAGNPSATTLWSTGETSPTITVEESGVYWVELSDGQGCTSTDTIEITIPELDLGDDGTLCGTALITGYDTTSVFLWSTGDTTPNLELINPGTYWVEVQEPLGCVLTDTIVVNDFADFPIVNLGDDFSACDSAELDAGNPGLSFVWSNGDTTQGISVYNSGVYTVSVTNEFDCTTEDAINVFIAPSPEAEFAYNDNGLTVFFENLSSLGSNFWDFGDGNTSNLISPAHTYADTGTYLVQLIVIDILNNCGADTFELEIQITSTTGIAPNQQLAGVEVFPNPTTDLLNIHLTNLADIDQVHLMLTNALGQVVHQEHFSPQGRGSSQQLSLQSLPAGIYQLRLLGGGKFYTQAIIKR